MTEEVKNNDQVKHYRMDAEVGAVGASMGTPNTDLPGAANQPHIGPYTGKGVRIADVTEVVDFEKDPAILQSWYEEADLVQDFEGFQKLTERLLGRYSHTPGTTPYAFIVIALAALKMADGSEQGGLNEEQWTSVMWGILQTMTNTRDQPLRIMKFADLLDPKGWAAYTQIPPDVMEWLRQMAINCLVDPENAGQSEDVKAHWTGIAKGQAPFGLKVGI